MNSSSLTSPSCCFVHYNKINNVIIVPFDIPYTRHYYPRFLLFFHFLTCRLFFDVWRYPYETRRLQNERGYYQSAVNNGERTVIFFFLLILVEKISYFDFFLQNEEMIKLNTVLGLNTLTNLDWRGGRFCTNICQDCRDKCLLTYLRLLRTIHSDTF